MSRVIGIILLALSLIVAGCASTRTNVEKAQELLCSPPQEIRDLAELAAQVVTAATAITGPIQGFNISSGVVIGIFDLVQRGACVLSSDLMLAISYYDAVVAQTPPASQYKGRPIPTPNIDPLRSWAKAGK